MREEFKKYRLSSLEEPTDEMLQELMEGFLETVLESNKRAEEENRRRLQEVADAIDAWRKENSIKPMIPQDGQECY